MFIITHKTFFLLFSALVVCVSLVAIGAYGLKLGIDFVGGSALEVDYGHARPALAEVQRVADSLNLGTVLVQPIGETGMLFRLKSLSEPERQTLVAALGQNVTVKRFDSIGPTIGQELKTRSIYAILLVILLIVLYITFAFRHVSRPVASWKYGLIAIVALGHDVAVPTGFFALYSHATGAEMDVLFISALLTILGFSVHDTIVVFDRIRENLRHAGAKESFAETVGKSLSQTFTRSINTSLTVVFTLLVLLFWGGASTHDFALFLAVGIAAGTYSSIFLASPLLVVVESFQKKS